MKYLILSLFLIGCSQCPHVDQQSHFMVGSTYSISWHGDEIFFSGSSRGVDPMTAYDIAAERFCRGEWPWGDAALPGKNKHGHRIYPMFDVMMTGLIDSIYHARNP